MTNQNNKIMRKARTPHHTQSIRDDEDIKKVMDYIISEEEKAHQRELESGWWVQTKPNSDLYHFNKSGSGQDVYERTKTECEAVGFKLVDLYDTTIWEELESVFLPYVQALGDDAFAADMPATLAMDAVKKFFDWMETLPNEVIVYASPTSHNVLMSWFQMMTPMATILQMTFVMFCFKGEDYHFAVEGNNAQSFYNAHIKKVLENEPFSTENIECPICCETPTDEGFMTDNTGYGGLIPCQSCGQCACEKCIHKFVRDQTDFELVKVNDKFKVRYHRPDHTCPYCRGGFWNPSDPTSLPRSLLQNWHEACKKMNNPDYQSPLLHEENQDYLQRIMEHLG